MNNKDQLLENIEKRFKTTMIGALAKFEENFAYLWENDTINRERYEDLWEETRNEILNNGNHQIRSALKELHQYLYGENTNFNQKYHYKFYFKNPGDDK
jgi:hypothetical protein